MIAASSTDDITLLSKKTTEEKFSLAQQPNESSSNHPLRVVHSSPHNLNLSPAQKSPTIYSDYESGGFNPDVDVQVAVQAELEGDKGPTDADAPLGVVKLNCPKEGGTKQPHKQQQHVSRSQDFLETTLTSIDYLDADTDTHGSHGNENNIPITNNVRSLKNRFESPPPPHNSTSPNDTTHTPTHQHSSHSQVVRPVGRRSSNGNSDSGRESMTDVVAIDIETT